jgi:hypothetical protein
MSCVPDPGNRFHVPCAVDPGSRFRVPCAVYGILLYCVDRGVYQYSDSFGGERTKAEPYGQYNIIHVSDKLNTFLICLTLSMTNLYIVLSHCIF